MIFQIISCCIEKSQDDTLINHAHEIVKLFMQDFIQNLEFMLKDIASLMKLVTLLLSSKNPQISETANLNLRRVMTVFSQLLDLKIQGNNKELMENPNHLKNLQQIAKESIQPARIAGMILIPVVSTLLSLGNKQRKEQEAGVATALEIFKAFSPDLKKESWQMVFLGILKPFVTDCLEGSHELAKRGQGKDDYYLKLMKHTMKEFFFLASATKDIDNILSYMETLGSLLNTSDKHIIDLYFELILEVLQNSPSAELASAMLQLISNMISKNLPKPLLNNVLVKMIHDKQLRQTKNLPTDLEFITLDIDSTKIMITCQVLLEAIKVASKIIMEFSGNVDEKFIEKLINNIEECYTLVSSFNKDILLRYLLWKCGYNAKSTQLPSLYKIEKTTSETIMIYLEKKVNKSGLKSPEGQALFQRFLG